MRTALRFQEQEDHLADHAHLLPDIRSHRARRDIADLVTKGRIETARLRVESLIQDDIQVYPLATTRDVAADTVFNRSSYWS